MTPLLASHILEIRAVKALSHLDPYGRASGFCEIQAAYGRSNKSRHLLGVLSTAPHFPPSHGEVRLSQY